MGAEAQAITATTLDSAADRPARDGARTARRSFNIVLDRLGSALSTQRRFMADASHELRTPDLDHAHGRRCHVEPASP